MLKQLPLLITLFLLGTETASADYVLIKINLNQLDFFPPSLMSMMQNPGAGGGNVGIPPGGMMGIKPGGMMGVQPGTQPGIPPAGGMVGGMVGGFGGAMPVPNPGGTTAVEEDPNARWISAYVEIKTKPRGMGMPFKDTTIWQYDHSYGKGVWMVISPHIPMFGGYIPVENFNTQFDTQFKKEMKEKGKKSEAESLKGFLHLARTALAHANLKQLRRAMKEASDINPKDPIVAHYLRVQKELQKPFKDIDPSQSDLIAELPGTYKPITSEQGHYSIYAQILVSDRLTEGIVKRRLVLMENTLEIFYSWFALQGDAAPQPALPKYRLLAVMPKDKEEFLTRHVQFGALPMVADGFTPRRENVMVLSVKSRVNDPRFAEFDTLLTNKLADANEKLKLYRINLTRDDLLTGKINELKEAGRGALFIAAAQTAVLLAHALEDQSERATITNEGVRQLLIASEMFPRNVQIPEWMVEGMAAFFETPSGGVYPTVGTPSWTHLISFKHFLSTKRLDRAPDVLFKVVTDQYFQEAHQLSARLQENRDNDALRYETKQAWELARCTAWAFVFYLAENKKLDYLARYGKELDKLPRDMELDDLVLQGCFARGFGMTDPKDARRIDRGDRKPFELMAESWFSAMQSTNLDMVSIQTHLLQQRAQQDVGQTTLPNSSPPAVNPNPLPLPPINPNPNPMPPPVNPMPPQALGLDNTHWVGQETLAGRSGKLEFQFHGNGKVNMVDKKGSAGGTYTLQGNSISMSFHNGNVIYTGNRNGSTIAGATRNPGATGNFTVTQGAGN